MLRNCIIFMLVCSFFPANFLFSQQDFQGISGINFDNYPRVDGSTATNPLNYIIAAKLLDLEYEWISRAGVNDVYFSNASELPLSFRQKLKCSQTHWAIINLVDNNGVKWATRNVGEKGKFVSSPKKNGNLYTWDEAQTVCPSGWRP